MKQRHNRRTDLEAFLFAGRVIAVPPELPIDVPPPDEWPTELPVDAPAPASRSEVCPGGDEPAESVDSLSLFPSEQVEVEGTGIRLPGPSTCATDASSDGAITPSSSEGAATRSFDISGGAAAPQNMADTGGSLTLEEHVAALTKLYDLCLDIHERLARAEQALQRTEDLATDRVLLDPYMRLDERLTRTEHTLRSLQATVPEIGKTVHDLGASIAKAFDRIEAGFRRTESLGGDRTLRQLAASIDTRLADTTETVSRIERLIGGVSLREFSAAINARLTQTEERLRQIERALGRSSRVDEHDQRASLDPRAARHELARWGMAMSKPMRAAQHWATDLWAVVAAPARPDHGTVPAWIAATTSVVGSHLARRFAAVLVLFGVLAAVTMRLDDPRLGLQHVSVDSGQGVHTSGKLSATTPVAVVPAVDTVPLASTMREAESTSRAKAVALPSRQTVIPERPRRTAPDDVVRTLRATPTQFVGTLEVTSNPAGASVFVNGQRMGVTPLRLPKQRAGSLVLQLTHEGYQRWSASIQVPANRLTPVSATLLPAGP